MASSQEQRRMVDHDVLADRRKALEESFFRNRNPELAQRMKQEALLEARRNELARASGITDKKLLDRLIDMNMESPTAAALALVPLVRVAWADDDLSLAEREAILTAAVETGMSRESATYHWLMTWLQEKPDAKLLECWKNYVVALLPTISADDRAALREGLLSRAKQVAVAAGGYLGLGNKVSEAEQRILDDLSAILL
ncbi:MAG TPA: hypothetical protein VIY86_06935 [Pirellulaceae bacterium]